MIRTANEEFENDLNPNSSSEPLECEIKVSLQSLGININQVIHINESKRKSVIYLLFRIH